MCQKSAKSDFQHPDGKTGGWRKKSGCTQAGSRSKIPKKLGGENSFTCLSVDGQRGNWSHMFKGKNFRIAAMDKWVKNFAPPSLFRIFD